MNADAIKQRCGFVAVIGAPNAGKSTLVNALVGGKVSIVSPKVQTTRTMVRGIVVKDQSQVIFIDTPGIFQPEKRLERAMVSVAWQGEHDADIVMLIVDAAHKKSLRQSEDIIRKLAGGDHKRPCVLVLNKVDKVKKEELFALAQRLNDMLPFTATFMVSALKENRTSDILDWLAWHGPGGGWDYQEDQLRDMPSPPLAAEITREKLFHRLHQELPYALTVETEGWENFDNGSIKIDQVVYVARETHKGIVLGKGGAQIKHIGETARQELETILECRVHLKIFVKVSERWQDDPERYALWGLDSSS